MKQNLIPRPKNTKIHTGEKKSILTNGDIQIVYRRMKIEHLPHICKIQLKIDYLTEEPETINILEENITKGVMLSLTKTTLK